MKLWGSGKAPIKLKFKIETCERNEKTKASRVITGI